MIKLITALMLAQPLAAGTAFAQDKKEAPKAEAKKEEKKKRPRSKREWAIAPRKPKA